MHTENDGTKRVHTDTGTREGRGRAVDFNRARERGGGSGYFLNPEQTQQRLSYFGGRLKRSGWKTKAVECAPKTGC